MQAWMKAKGDLTMAKQQKHTASDHPVVPNKKTVAATKEARRGSLKSVKNLEELFKALDEDEAARPETVSRFEVFEDGKRAYVRSGVAIEVSYLDDDRTLKVFVKARKKAPT
jgi:hypothetical protein